MENLSSSNFDPQSGVKPGQPVPSMRQDQPLPPPEYVELPKKSVPKYSSADAVFAWLCFALGFVFARFVTQYSGGLWGGIFWALFGALTAGYTRIKRIKTSRAQKAVFAVAEIFCLTPIFCANGFINTLAAWFSFLLMFYLFITISGAELFGKRFASDMFKSVFVRPFMSFGKAPCAAFSPIRKKNGAKNIGYVFIGLLIALPITIVAAVLLVMSDAFFESLMTDFFSALPGISLNLIWQLIFGALIGMFLFGAIYSATKPAEGYNPAAPAFRILPAAISYTAVTPVCIFYVVYIITQIGCIISAVCGNPPENFSFSDFARRGFFELCIIAVINLCLITAMQCFTARGESDRPTKALRIYTVVISGLTLLLIASAFSKMALYIGRYGLTQLRVYTSWFMAVLEVVFVVIIIQQFADIPMWRVLFIGFTLLFSVLCFGNVDGQIARYNISAYRSGALSELDLSYLEEINGIAACEPLAELIINGGEPGAEITGDSAAEFIRDQISIMDQQDDFAYFSIPRTAARNAARRAGIE